jgi:phytoene desaturase
MKRAAVVGAGLGGLSAAVHLALAGFEVEVFEQAQGPGGKASERRLGPYRFDAGPSLITMAEVWDELFAAAGKRREDALKLTPLDPVAQYFWPGARLTAPGTAEGLADAFAAQGWAPKAATLAWFAHGRALWDLAGPVFLRQSLHDGATWTSPQTWKTLLGAGRLDSGRSLKDAIDSRFTDPRVRQFFGRYATYNGSDPHRIPATFALVPWVEFGRGTWAADEGIHAIPRAMHKLAVDLGVTFHFSAEVQAVVHQRGRIEGLRLGSARASTKAFDVVVSNADVGPTYALLAAGGDLGGGRSRWRQKYRKGEPSTSGVVFLWGMDTTHPELGLHNVFFSPDHDAEFRNLFGGRLPDDPTVYVNITSKTTPADAPPGHENWFVLVNAPHDPGPVRIATGEALARLREATLNRIEANLGRPVRNHIVQEAVITPADLEASTGSPGGSLYGLASHSALAAFDRHPNRAPGFRGLYLCGGSAHPGGGMPLAVLSGRIAAHLATKDFRPVQRNDGTP